MPKTDPPTSLPDLPLGPRRTHDVVQWEPPATGRVDFEALFGRSAPVELEVGVGKGRFLLLAATARPEVDFIGLDYARRYLQRAIDRIGKRGLTNVRLAHAEALSFLTDRLKDRCLSAVHVYFPDPWPKKRHHKRRFFRQQVLDQLARVMRDEAELHAVTDHADYAEVIDEVVKAHPLFESLQPSVARELPHETSAWQLSGMDEYTQVGVTNFEIKYRREGRPIHRFAWRRVARADNK